MVWSRKEETKNYVFRTHNLSNIHNGRQAIMGPITPKQPICTIHKSTRVVIFIGHFPHELFQEWVVMNMKFSVDAREYFEIGLPSSISIVVGCGIVEPAGYVDVTLE